MSISASTRQALSKQRKALFEQLNVWLQREKDMEVAASLRHPGVPEKLSFIRQERAKLEKEIFKLDRGFRRQRAWSQGKLNY
jgi:hypothetical protein